MAKFKYIGPEMMVGRFGRLAPGAIVELWCSEAEFIRAKNSPEWEDCCEEDVEGVGVIVPTKTGGFDLTRIDWLREARPSLRRMSRSELTEVCNSMRYLGCKVPTDKEARNLSREHLFELLYGESKRLRWDQLGYQGLDRNSKQVDPASIPSLPVEPEQEPEQETGEEPQAEESPAREREIKVQPKDKQTPKPERTVRQIRRESK